MPRDFHQIEWSAELEADCAALIRLAIAEDLGGGQDWTTISLIKESTAGRAMLVVRQPGVIAGLAAGQMVLRSIDPTAAWTPLVADGDRVTAGQPLAEVEGPARSLLSAERVMLNLVSRLSGIATLTRQYVEAVQGTGAQIYDTRKTTPAYRRLEKYAVRQGGGRNHRLNLSAAVLIKDNHLAVGAMGEGRARYSVAEAVGRARGFLAWCLPAEQAAGMLVEIEVDTLHQFQEVLPVQPDVILLDNMHLADLRSAVKIRDAEAPSVILEASGGVSLETLPEIAGTGVDRISVGAITHSAVWLDIALDWR